MKHNTDNHVGRVREIAHSLKRLSETQKETERKFDEIMGHIVRNGTDIRNVSQRLDKLSEQLETVRYKQDDLQKQLYELEASGTGKKTGSKVASTSEKSTSSSSEDLFAENHLLDVFYTRFEDRFKDTAETKRLYKTYDSYFVDGRVDFKKLPVLDVGCGRGEFLEYLSDLGIRARGMDINTDMVKRANEKGLKVDQGEALDYLKKSKARSLGAITGFHLVEHIPFPTLLAIFSAAHTCLTKNGFVLFETPNPENIVVATNSFYFDPSHLKPLPPELLAFALEVSGFREVEIVRSYPVKTENTDNLPQDVFDRLYGPRNYAVIGYK